MKQRPDSHSPQLNTASPLRFIKNSASNLLNGASTAILAIGLPYYLVRYFDASAFGIWVLILQLGGYTNYLNFGIQTAVGRYVAEALNLDKSEKIGPIVSAGTQFLTLLALVATIALVITAYFFNSVFRQVDPSLLMVAQCSLLWIGSAFILALPASALLGVFIGEQKNEIPAYLAVGTRLLTFAATAWVAASTHGLLETSIAFFMANVIGVAIQYCVYVRYFPLWRIRLLEFNVPLSIDLAKYCTSLAVWSMAMLLISGLSITLVGMLDFENLAYFGVAISLVAFLVGIQQSIFSPLIQVFAGNHARGRTVANEKLLIGISAICSSLLVFISSILFSFGREILTAWVGINYADKAYPMLLVLVVGNAIRYSATPYALWLIATGNQKKVLLTPILEGLTNLGVSVWAGYYYGAVGVACGIVAGGLVSIATHFLINMPRTLDNSFNRLELGLHSLLIPASIIVVAVLSHYVIVRLGGEAVYGECAAVLLTLLYIARSGQVMMKLRSR